MRSLPVRAAAVIAVVLVALSWSTVAMAGTAGLAQTDPPRATLSAGGGAPGAEVEVRGKGWPKQSIVQAQVCGNLHLNGSIDCARSGAVTKAVNGDGSFAVTLTVGMPPTPCPCVVAVATFDGKFPIDLPFEVTGAPTATPKRAETKVPEFRLLATRVVDEPSLGSRFGMADTRVVASTVHNVGTSPILELPVTVTFGQGADPSRVIAIRTVRDLAPGEQRTIRASVPIDALSAGSYTAIVTAGVGDRSISESVAIPAFPWLLVLLVAVLGIIVLVVVFVRLSRSRRLPPPVAAPDGPVPAGFDPDALERELADELQLALLAVPSSIRSGSPAVVADQVAPGVAATVADRHHLDAVSAAALEAGLRAELAAGLGRAPSPPAPAGAPLDAPDAGAAPGGPEDVAAADAAT